MARLPSNIDQQRQASSPTSRLRVKLRRAKGERKNKVVELFDSPEPSAQSL